MNFSPELATGPAVFLALLAAFMWGTWFISLKYLGDYPIEAYILTVFVTSAVFVWLVGFVIDGGGLVANIVQAFTERPATVWVTLLCGVLYVTGIILSLTVLSTIGLSLSQPIQSSINILVGTYLAGVIGGVPPNLPVGRIVLSVLFLLAAVIATMTAGNLRANAQGESSLQFTRRDLWRSLLLIVLASVLIQAYTFALSFGLRSTMHPEGMAVMPFMAVLATGALIGALLNTIVPLTRKRAWGAFWRAPFALRRWGIFSGLFHYGGNIIHTFATAILSPVITWPLGVTMGLWTQIWGLVYGEFKGYPRRVYAALFLGLGFYLAGALVMAVR